MYVVSSFGILGIYLRSFAFLASCIDIKAFYMCYYWHCSTEEILCGIKDIWKTQTSTLWPAPYFDISPDGR